MLDTDTKRRIDACRDILVGKAPGFGGHQVLAIYSEAIQGMRQNPGVPEQALINANRELVRRFEAKIKTTIDRVWGAA